MRVASVSIGKRKQTFVMLRPVSTLPLSKTAILELCKSSCIYVEDIENSEDWTCKYADKLFLMPTTLSALDLVHEELQRENLTTLCEALDNILEGGIQCGAITEICGAYGSGKTQICLQTSVICQLPKECGGLNAQSLYIDTRNGFSPSRVRDLIRGCQKRFPNVRIDEGEILKGIKVSSPPTLEDLLLTIQSLKNYLRTDSEIRVVILDSLALPVQCTFGDGWQRTKFYFRVIDELTKITAKNNVAAIIVNELSSQIDAKGAIVYESAGGQFVAHRVHKRFVVKRFGDCTFAAKILKASSMPQISVEFQITEDGIRDKSKDPPK